MCTDLCVSTCKYYNVMCECQHVSIYVYVHMYRFMCIYMQILHTYLSTCIYLCTCMFELCVYTCTYEQAYISTCIYLPTYLHICTHEHVICVRTVCIPAASVAVLSLSHTCSIRLGVFLRRHPQARLFVIFYGVSACV